MDRQDWYDMGARVGKIVQDAVESEDFEGLNRSITETLDAALKLFVAPGTAYGDAEEAARQRALEREAKKREAAKTRTGAQVRTEGDGKGLFLGLTGAALTALFGFMALSSLFVGSFFGGFGLAALIFALLAGGSAFAATRGLKSLRLGRKQKAMLKAMGDRDVITMQEVADVLGCSQDEARKQVREMISSGMFLDTVYMDEQGTCLMTSENAYRQYRETQAAYVERTRQRSEAESRLHTAAEKSARSAAGESDGLTDEQRQIVEEGRAFIAHIRSLNEQITDEEMSEKLLRLEMVVTRIFDQVAAKPDSAPDLRRMMSYYLPTTQKLVDIYAELDKQTVQGPNVQKTKAEIEKSLDTINTAFENLLDSFFQETSWDVASDITVMHTMMAQDGLTGTDFHKQERTKKVAGDVTGKKSGAEEAAQAPAAAGAAAAGAAGAAAAAGTAAAGAAGAVAGAGAGAAGAAGAAAAEEGK